MTLASNKRNEKSWSGTDVRLFADPNDLISHQVSSVKFENFKSPRRL